MKTILLIFTAVVLLTVTSHAQTNSTTGPAVPPPAAAPNPQVVKLADDVRQVVLDVAGLMGGVSWSGVIITAYLGIKGIRNRTSLGSGKLSGILNLLNLEAKTPPKV